MNADRAQAAVTLRVDLSSAELTGLLVASDQRTVEFTGWMELASAIEDWRRSEAAAAGGGKDA